MGDQSDKRPYLRRGDGESLIVFLALLINGVFLPVLPVEIPLVDGYISAPTYAGTQIIIAHADMAGAEFLKLEPGDYVYQFYSDYSRSDYIVDTVEKLHADDPRSMELSLFYDGQWTYILDVLRDKRRNDMTLYTCWYSHGLFLGRVFVNLKEAQ